MVSCVTSKKRKKARTCVKSIPVCRSLHADALVKDIRFCVIETGDGYPVRKRDASIGSLFSENLRLGRRFQVALAMNRLKRGNSFAEDGGAINQLHQDQQRSFKMDEQSLSHTTWNCKYHIVFAPKYRRRVIYGTVRKEIGKILRELCLRKGVEIIEAERS